jgi:hypothetical protein
VYHVKQVSRPRSCLEALLDAGIVPLFSNVVGLGSEKLMGSIAMLMTSLLLAIPAGVSRKLWGQLPRAIAGLIQAKPPVAPGTAAEMLCLLALKHEKLLADYQSWGMGPSLKRLTRHRDPHTSSAAEQLVLMMDKGIQNIQKQV